MKRFGRRRMRLRKPVKRWKVILLTTMFITLLFTIQTFYFIEHNLRPAFENMAENVTRKIATEAINDAITKKVTEETNYPEIVQFYKDDRGVIRSAVFNLAEANRIKSQTTNRVQSVLQQFSDNNTDENNRIYMPLGQAFDSTILATFGPRIPIHIEPIGTAKSDIVEQSETLGINQTKHTLTLDILVRVSVIIPFVTHPMELHSRVPIASFVVVGEVPQVFLDGQGSPFIPAMLPGVNGQLPSGNSSKSSPADASKNSPADSTNNAPADSAKPAGH